MSSPSANRAEADIGVAPSFEEWYEAFYPRLAKTMTVMFSSVDVGREIADEAMAKAFGRWQKGDPPHSSDGWTLTVAVNEGRQRWRRRQRESQRFAETARNAEVMAQLDEADLDLWRAVDNLPPRSREAIVLRYVADLTEAGVADAMGVKEGSASALLHKARAALRRALDEETDR